MFRTQNEIKERERDIRGKRKLNVKSITALEKWEKPRNKINYKIKRKIETAKR